MKYLPYVLLILGSIVFNGRATFALDKNPGVIQVLHPEDFDRVLAISDVHGMYQNLIPLLQAAKVIDTQRKWMGAKTLLLVVGDSVDKGSQSVEVIDLWMTLQDQAPTTGGMLIHLLGNHEAEFLANPHNKKAETFLDELQKRSIGLDQFTDPQYPRANFLRMMPIAARIGNWLFAHSGYLNESDLAKFISNATNTLDAGKYGDSFVVGDDSILEAKKWETDPKLHKAVISRLNHNGLRGIIFGHQPKALHIEGACGISTDHRLVKIDNGMAPEAGSHVGSILNISFPTDLTTQSDPRMNVILPSGKMTELVSE